MLLRRQAANFRGHPRTQPRFCDAQGVNVAQNMCSYFSHCYVISNNKPVPKHLVIAFVFGNLKDCFVFLEKHVFDFWARF